jgi:hypothetical protein
MTEGSKEIKEETINKENVNILRWNMEGTYLSTELSPS